MSLQIVQKGDGNNSSSSNSPFSSPNNNPINELEKVTRSPLINDTVQATLDSLSAERNEVGKKSLIEKIVEETIEREKRKMDFATRIRPDLHQAMLDTIAHYGWTTIIYLYSTNEGNKF